MRARDQSSIFSTGGKFCPDYGLLLELHALTLVARSYALLIRRVQHFSLLLWYIKLFMTGHALLCRLYVIGWREWNLAIIELRWL